MMKNNLSGAAPQQAVAKRRMSRDGLLLASDRPGWAWEFLRRNPGYRAASATVGPVKHRRVSAISVIEAPDCVPEVRNFGICFR